MGWLDDILGNLGKAASNHEELLGAIPLIAGSALLARNGRLGAPIGAGLATLGGLMELRNQQQKPQSPIEFYNPKTQQIEYQTPTVGQPLTPPTGYQPFDVYKLEQQKKQGQGAKPFPIYNPATGEERFFDPSKSDTVPKGFVSASFYKKPGEEKTPGGIYSGAYQAYLIQHPGDTVGAARAATKAETDARIAARPVTNIDVQTPVSPADIAPALPGSKEPGAVLMRSKSGKLTAVPSPIGPKPPPVGKSEDFLTARGKAMAQAKTELTNPGYIFKGVPAGPKIAARANDLLIGLGWNPATGQRLKEGEKVKLSNGTIAIWHDK